MRHTAKSKFFLIMFVLFAAAGGALIALAQKPAELPSPTIAVSPDVYYPLDEVLYLEGRADPSVTVEIQLTKSGAKPRKFSVRADPRGEWVLAEKVPLEAGDWEARARAIGAKDTVSDWSNPRVFKTIVSGITIGGVNIKFAFLVLVIVVLLLLGGVAFLYFYTRVRSLQAVLRDKEIREAKERFVRGYPSFGAIFQMSFGFLNPAASP